MEIEIKDPQSLKNSSSQDDETFKIIGIFLNLFFYEIIRPF